MISSNGLRPAFRISSTPCRSLPLRSNGLRKFSSLPNPSRGISSPQSSRAQHTSSLFSTRWRNPNITAPTFLATASGIRFNSTSPTQPSAPINDASPSWTPTTTDGTIEDLLDSASLTNAPESIGYLKSLGLDYGWGPTSCAEWVLEHVHVYSGLPWGASILASAALVRLACFYFYVKSADTTAKMRALTTVVEPLKAKMMEAIQNKDQEAAMRYRKESTQVYKDMGIKPLRHTMPGPIIQGMMGFGAFRLSRAMADIPVPGLLDQGALWVTNLTMPDPLYLLPLASSAAIHCVGRLGGETGASVTPGMKTILLYGLPGLMFLFSFWLPAATQLTFFAGSALSLVQAFAFRNPAIRRALRITPIYTTTAPVRTLETRFVVRKPSQPAYQSPTATGAHGSGSVAKQKGWGDKFYDKFKDVVGQVMPAALARLKDKEGSRKASLKRQADAYERARRAELDHAKRMK